MGAGKSGAYLPRSLQTLWFCHLFIFWILNTKVFPGRVDQYLYPYYQKDIEEED